MTSVETDLLARVPAQLFIGGEWVDAAGGATFAVHAPSTGEVVREIADASPEDGIRALDAAVAQQQQAAGPGEGDMGTHPVGHGGKIGRLHHAAGRAGGEERGKMDGRAVQPDRAQHRVEQHARAIGQQLTRRHVRRIGQIGHDHQRGGFAPAVRLRTPRERARRGCGAGAITKPATRSSPF